MRKTDYPRIYRIWLAMRNRCNNPKTDRYQDYGGRGIRICSEWDDYLNFEKWALTNGYSENLSIDRLDNDGDYEPSNCRWATNLEQANNSRQCNFINYQGRTFNVTQWAKVKGLTRACLNNRINVYGWSIEEAMETPMRKNKNRKEKIR